MTSQRNRANELVRTSSLPTREFPARRGASVFSLVWRVRVRIYLLIRDDNPYVAYLLACCFEQRIISEYKYAEKLAQEETDLAAMTEEEQEQELIDRVDEGYDCYMDLLLDKRNDEDDAVEERDGYFDLYLDHVKEGLLQKTCFSAQLPTNVEERSAMIQEKLWEALHVLYEKRYLRYVWLCNQLNKDCRGLSMSMRAKGSASFLGGRLPAPLAFSVGMQYSSGRGKQAVTSYLCEYGTSYIMAA